MSPRVLVSFALLCAPLAHAGVLYKCTDEGGHTTYTNSKGGYRNCTVISRDASSPQAGASATPARPKAAGNPSPADFPRVSGDTQKSRDGDRRHILEQELASEQRNLDEARKALAEQETARAPAERLQSYRDRIAMHNRNLEALQREMSKLK